MAPLAHLWNYSNHQKCFGLLSAHKIKGTMFHQHTDTGLFFLRCGMCSIDPLTWIFSRFPHFALLIAHKENPEKTDNGEVYWFYQLAVFPKHHRKQTEEWPTTSEAAKHNNPNTGDTSEKKVWNNGPDTLHAAVRVWHTHTDAHRGEGQQQETLQLGQGLEKNMHILISNWNACSRSMPPCAARARALVCNVYNHVLVCECWSGRKSRDVIGSLYWAETLLLNS